MRNSYNPHQSVTRTVEYSKYVAVNGESSFVCVRVCVCVRARVCACVRVCVCVRHAHPSPASSPLLQLTSGLRRSSSSSVHVLYAHLRSFLKPPSSTVPKGKKKNRRSKAAPVKAAFWNVVASLIERKNRSRNWRRLVERRQSTVPSFRKEDTRSPQDALDLCDLTQENRDQEFKKQTNKKTKANRKESCFGNRHVHVKVSPIRIELFGPRGDFHGFF